MCMIFQYCDSCAIKGLMSHCITNEVPFPAYETFYERERLPRRFFLYYDLFLQAARHNKEAWKEAILPDSTKRFGTCALEAHVHVTIQENYFKWIFQMLSDRKLVEHDHVVDDFETEYDYYESTSKGGATGENLTPLDVLVCNTWDDCVPGDVEIIEGKVYVKNEEQGSYHPVEGSDNMGENVNLDSCATMLPEDITKNRDQERQSLQELINKIRHDGGKHMDLLKHLRKEAKELRKQAKTMSDKEFRVAQSACLMPKIERGEDGGGQKSNSKKKSTISSKKRSPLALVQLMDDEITERSKKRAKGKSGSFNQTRCSNTKIEAFKERKKIVESEEKNGLRAKWDNIYRMLVHHREKSRAKLDGAFDDERPAVSASGLLTELDWIEL